MRSQCCLPTFCSEKKKIPPRLICMCPSNLRLHCIPCLLPVRILCFNRCLFTAEKLINPNACLTKFENTKIQSCAQPDCLHGFASHMCNYSQRWQINYLLGLCVTMMYNVLGCESKLKKVGGREWGWKRLQGVVKKWAKKELAPKAIFLICQAILLNQT